MVKHPRLPFWRHSRFLAALVLLGVSASAWADTAPPYAQVLRETAGRAPALLEQAALMRAARHEAQQAHARPNPAIGLEVENLGTRDVDASRRQTTLSITQPFEILGKRSARIAAGQAGIATADAREHQVQANYTAQLAIAYATAEAGQQRLHLAQDDLTRADEELHATEALVTAGREADLRLAQARASRAAILAAREGAKADLTDALADLSALAGIEEAYTGVQGSLLAAPSAVQAGPSLDPPPAVRLAQAERDEQAAQVTLERKKPIPDIGLSAGARRFGGSNETGLVVGVSANIPLFNRNQGAIAAAQDRQEAAEQRLNAARMAAMAGRRSALARAEAAESRVQAATEGEAAAAQAYRLARIGYDAGKIPLLEVLSLRRALTEASTLTIDARLARVRAMADLARLDGHLAFGDR